MMTLCMGFIFYLSQLCFQKKLKRFEMKTINCITHANINLDAVLEKRGMKSNE
jgi:hypothetical protein